MTLFMRCETREILLLFTFLFGVVSVNNAANISCYQCTKNANEECPLSDLKSCPSFSDRCVTHIAKSDSQGFKIKRECGLGPCSFGDSMMNKGLGMDDCDRSTDEYFCVFCCRENGCNQNSSPLLSPSIFIYIAALIVLIINIFQKFQPPYVVTNSD